MREHEVHNIRLKLLSDNNVILAKCDGMETEVFMPTIIEGRISIINVIPQRRCNCIATTYLVAKRKTPARRIESPSDTLHNWHVSMSSENKTQRSRAPLANSTPSQIIERNVKNKATNVKFLTPEPMRRAVAHVNTSVMVPAVDVSKSLQFEDLEVEQSVVPPSHFSDDNISQQEAPAGDILNMDWPQTLPVQRQQQIVRDDTIVLPSAASPAMPQWRKVLIPKRTYARRDHALNTTYRPLINDIPQNPQTQVPKPDYRIVHIVRRLIIDEKLEISPSSFKHQLKSKPLESLHQQYRKDLHSFFDGASKRIAFDLLTKPASKPKFMADELVQLFRKRCVNKGSSTYPKYKKLCKPALIEAKSSLCDPNIVRPVELKATDATTLRATPVTTLNSGFRNNAHRILPQGTIVQLPSTSDNCKIRL